MLDRKHKLGRFSLHVVCSVVKNFKVKVSIGRKGNVLG